MTWLAADWGHCRNVVWLQTSTTHAANHATKVGMKMMKTIALRIRSLQARVASARYYWNPPWCFWNDWNCFGGSDTHSGDFKLPENGASIKLKISGTST